MGLFGGCGRRCCPTSRRQTVTDSTTSLTVPPGAIDPLSALSIATGIVTFIDFGAQLVTLYVEIQKSGDGRPAAFSALETESRELSGHVTHALDNIAALKERYPRQAELLARLAAQCGQAEKDLRSLADSLTVKSGSQGGLRGRGVSALLAIRSRLKQGDIDALQDRLRSIREQLMMATVMCIAAAATEGRGKLDGLDSGVGEVLDILRPMKTAITDLQPEFASVSRSKPLETVSQRVKMTNGLWASIATAEGVSTADPPPSPATVEQQPDDIDNRIRAQVLHTLEFQEMKARESQIETPFPDTFQWLLEDQRPNDESGGAGTTPPPTKFKLWLESKANDAPFWVTGVPASGKSTLMKFIANNPNIRRYLETWSRETPLLMCSVYFWNPGSSSQKSQVGLLSTILYQLLSQRPDLSRRVAWTRYRYFQLAGPDAPDPPLWTLDELQSGLIRFISGIEGTGRLALFVDGLDEYDGDLDILISFLKGLHSDHQIKLCVSSRPWNAFKDAFRTYPSLRMEQFTKPDIVKYVRSRMGDSPAFQELRGPFAADVEKLESQIIEKANGVFLWVVLVVQNMINTAQDNNDLGEIWKVFGTLPVGLQELYASMRERLDPTRREVASKMYQLLFCWNEEIHSRIGAVLFWTALNCSSSITTVPSYPTDAAATDVIPVLERRIAGATGGILQVQQDRRYFPYVGFLHRTVYDWLQSIRLMIESDGPANYNPGLVLAATQVSCVNHQPSAIGGDAAVFEISRSCGSSPETRTRLLRIVDQLQDGAILKDGVKHDPAARFLLAAQHMCVPYLRARLESVSHSVGLEFPWWLHIVPVERWPASRHSDLSSTIARLLYPIEPSRMPGTRLRDVQFRLKTFEALLQANLVPRRVLQAMVTSYARLDGGPPPDLPRQFWDALLAGLDGKGFTEITEVDIYIEDVDPDSEPPRFVPVVRSNGSLHSLEYRPGVLSRTIRRVKKRVWPP